MCRRLGTLLLLVYLLVLPFPRPALAAPPATFLFAGSGFGHGVGMSQYGAYGQALEGRSATQILQHYYTGVSVAPTADAVPIRVNLVHAVPTAQVRGEALGAGGGAIQVVAGGSTFDGAANEAFTFGVANGQVTVSKNGTALATAPSMNVLWSGNPTVLNVAGPGETFEQSGHRYRYGMVDVAVVGTALEVVNELNLHSEYVRGIAEVPSSWPTETLKAQAIAARTYAMRKQRAGLRAECRCHVFDGTIDQVFAGWSKESGAQGDRWVAAVEATQGDGTGIVVLHEGAPISANYYSSSGGRTEGNEEVFGGTALPYLRSVDDHWSLESYNPRASWTFTKSQAEVAAAFGLPDVVSIDLSRRTVGGSVKTAVATASSGATATITGQLLRSRLGLPGAWIRKPVVRVSGADRFATSVAIGQVAFTTPKSVVLASGEDAHLVDGLVAAPLAKQVAGPLLLATVAGLPDPVAAEIDRLKPTTAYLVGGEGALGPGVEAALRARGVTTIERMAGADRYETAALVAREMGGSRPQVVVASGESGHLIDALAAGGPAAGSSRPILLVGRDVVPAPTAKALTDLGVSSTVVVGGTASISDATKDQLPSPTRVAGSDRWTTALAVADSFSGIVGVTTIVVASGADGHLVDALPGGSLGSVTVLTAVSPLTPATRSWLVARTDVGGVRVLGGTAAVASSTFDSIRSAVGG